MNCTRKKIRLFAKGLVFPVQVNIKSQEISLFLTRSRRGQTGPERSIKTFGFAWPSEHCSKID